MATRFYLPNSGTAPLGSLAVDSSWGISTGLVRRPTKIAKSDTALGNTSQTWASASTNDWVWYQFQSPCMSTGYSWTTSDTVSMVLGKCYQAENQTDTHLAYCVRVVSQDGGTVRGTVGVYQSTSTEFPLSASAATRIHSARTNGASNFSSQAGDRIIIEIGIYGVTPSLTGVTMRVGDPSATADFALTEGLTTDLCPWVELSRDVSFSLSSSVYAYTKGKNTATDNQIAYINGAALSATDQQPVYIRGKSTITDQQPSYVEGAAPSATDQQAGYIKGQDTSTDQQPAYTKGKDTSTDSQSSYILGQDISTDNQSAFVQGKDSISDQQSSYVRGESTSADTQPSYIVGSDTATDNQIAFVQGKDTSTDQQPAYIEGYTTAVALVPISDISQSGLWVNETSGSSPLYDSLDEQPSADDDDYVTHVNASGTEYFEVGLTAANGTPSAGDATIHFRGKDNSAGSTITVELRQGETVIATKEQALTGSNADYTYTLTSGEKSSITDWNDLRIRVTISEEP